LCLSQNILQILIDRLVRSHQQGESVLLFPRKILRRVNSALVQDGVDSVVEEFRDHFGGAFECDRILCFDGLLGSIHIVWVCKNYATNIEKPKIKLQIIVKVVIPIVQILRISDLLYESKISANSIVILEHSMGVGDLVGIGLSYRYARQPGSCSVPSPHRLF
jgi:hypothetical protein